MKLFDTLRGKQKNDQTPQGKQAAEVVVSKEEKKTAPAVRTAAQTSALVPGVLLHPLVTEKGTRLAVHNVYQFAVAKNAGKITIIRAFEARYGVRPTRVRVMNRVGKWVNFGKTGGARNSWKRALITLPEGKSVNVHEGV